MQLTFGQLPTGQINSPRHIHLQNEFFGLLFHKS